MEYLTGRSLNGRLFGRAAPHGVVPRAAALVVGGALAVGAGLLVAYGRADIALGLALAIPSVAVVLRYPFAAILIWVLVTPYFLRGLTAEISPALWAVHRLLIPAVLLIVGVYHAFNIRQSPFRLSGFDYAIALFAVIGLANVELLSANPARTLVEFYDKLFVPILLFWLVRAIAPRRSDLQRLVAVGAWTIVVQGTIGALAWLAPSLVPEQWLSRLGERATGTFGGPAPYTVTIVFFALLLVHEAMSRRAEMQRFWLLAVVVGALVAVFLSLSRGSWLGAAVVLGGLCFVYPRIAARIAIGGVVLLLVLGIGPLGSELALAQQRLETQSTVEGRIITNDAAIRMVSDRPLLGFGFSNFELFDERYKQRVGDTPLKVGGSAHNTYLNMAAELGVPSLVLYFVPPAWLLFATLRLRVRARDRALVNWQLIAVLWLAVLDQFVVSNFLEMIHSSLWATGLWWMTLGLIAVALQSTDRGPMPPPQRRQPDGSYVRAQEPPVDSR